MPRRYHASLCIAAALSILAARADAQWHMKKGPLMTRWAADVKPDSVLPEYPRPQLTRPDWQNLNGVWEYQPGGDGEATPVGKKLSSQILVPFPVESAISGVMEHHDRLWYRRQFSVPAAWKGRRTVLHFGAVDYESEVFVNGKSVGVHKGGYDPFGYDVTEALKPSGPQELIVRVFDPTNAGGQPRGKQSLRPGGIMYTPCSGIWQSVWIEPVAAGGVDHLTIVPDVNGGQVKITVHPLGDAPADTAVTVNVRDGKESVGSVEGKPGQELVVKIPDAKLWSPDSPHLYDFNVSVKAGGKTVDEVGSYFGMRKIEIGDTGDGIKRMLLNGKFTFQIGPLDQGFWPDGIYTQPTEAALKYDIQTTKDLGFNFIRKHIKVEPARWYYWCDKIGLMVWQDMPSANSYDDKPTPPVDKPQYKSELTRMVQALYNVPSIIMWETFNEGQGQHDTKELVALVKELDPTRLVNQASGGGYEGVGDVYDIHSYPPPNVPAPNPDMALACGEYGGIGFKIPGHMWKNNEGGGYTDVRTPQDLVDLYSEFTNLLKTFRDEKGLSAAVYTQTTDVETEINGLLTYDRQPKADVKLLAKANRFELLPPTYTPVVPTSKTESQTWKYTFDKPADDWMKATFKDAAWQEGPGGFGTKDTPNIGQLGTVWSSNDVWLRRSFKLDRPVAADAKLMVTTYHDEDVQVFINGVPAFDDRGHNGHYENRPISDAARRAIKPDGDNVLAVHCHQTVFGQYIDVGLTVREPAKQ